MKKKNTNENKNRIVFWLIACFFISCNSKNSKYYLTSDQDSLTSFEVIKTGKKMILVESAKNISKVKLNLILVGNEYVEYSTSHASKKPLVYISTKKHYYLQKNRFSMVDDSISTGHISEDNYYSEVKSNKKPVSYKFFYNSDLKIIKIEYSFIDKTYNYETTPPTK